MYRIIIFTLFIFSQSAPGATLLVDDTFAGYTAAGLSPGGAGGTLDSTLWTVTGASSGDSVFGDTHGGGDFARGESPGRVSRGGLYAFLLPGDTRGLGVQATASDFTPGRITRRVVNDTGAALVDLAVELDLWFLNNGSRSTRMGVTYAHSLLSPWTPFPGLQLDTPGTADALGWQAWPVVASLPVSLLSAGESLHVSWQFDDRSGSGSRDEIALSGLRLTGRSPAAVALPEPGSMTLALVAVVLAMAFRVATPRDSARRAPARLTSTARSPSTSVQTNRLRGPARSCEP